MVRILDFLEKLNKKETFFITGIDWKENFEKIPYGEQAMENLR